MQRSIPTLRPPASSPVGAGSGDAFVVRFLVDGTVVETPLPVGAALVVGRNEDNDVPLADHSMSRRHAVLLADEAGVLSVEDLGSANGTSVDGRSLASGARETFEPGSLLRLGETLGTVHRSASGLRAPRSEGTTELAHALEHLAASGADMSTAGLCLCEGGGADELLSALEALTPPDGHVARLDARRVVCLLTGVSRERIEARAKLLTTFFVARRIHVAFRALAFDERTTPEAVLAKLVPRPPPPPYQPLPTSKPTVGQGMRRVFELVHHVAPTLTSVLILGETGAGKEVIARTIHARSGRPAGPFVALNCAALPEALLEGELFGYEKGAFTGATQAKAGLVETASGGTLFLDELGEMPLATQSKLLRVLEDGAVLRLGSLKPRPVAFRLLAATNRAIHEEIQAKRFRADLYYRLNGLTIVIPPLRERRDEIEPLVALFARHAAARLSRPVPRFSEAVTHALHAHAWPGNVRELRNVVERLVLLAGDGTAELEHLPEEVTNIAPPEPSRPAPSSRRAFPSVPDEPGGAGGTHDDEQDPMDELPRSQPGAGALPDDLARLERARILEALEQCAGNQTRAARMLGITRRVLTGRLDRYGVARPRK